MSTAKERLTGISGVQVNGNTGGAAKRVFKPTIPTTRRSGGGSGVTPGSGGTGGGNGNREGRDQNNSCNGKVKSKEKTRKSKGKKDLIQLDATFNGINITSNSIKPEKGFISPGGSGYGQTSDTRTLRSSQSDSLKGIGSSGTSGCGGGVNHHMVIII
ncbi:putative lysozyme-like protein [Panonychus citri]|uniref:putative lysozyme-like protein n=1 Tax=Panonychus citri TaxID=50023 RepID=UPI002307CC24|nr:putative lysozyme-like protein [Panonychus citri]